MHALELLVQPGRYAVCRLDPDADEPPWAHGGALSSVTRTASELSIVCAHPGVPDGVRAEHGFVCLSVVGPLDFALTGVLAELATCLAEAHVPLFALSTFDTDHVLVRADDLGRAVEALTAAGVHVVDPGGT